MIKELKTLYDECRSYSCIEHATGIIEEVKAPDNLSKKISTISLTGADKKVSFIFKKFPIYVMSSKLVNQLGMAMEIAESDICGYSTFLHMHILQIRI